MNARTNAPVQEDERLLAEDDEDRVDQLEQLGEDEEHHPACLFIWMVWCDCERHGNQRQIHPTTYLHTHARTRSRRRAPRA